MKANNTNHHNHESHRVQAILIIFKLKQFWEMQLKAHMIVEEPNKMLIKYLGSLLNHWFGTC